MKLWMAYSTMALSVLLILAMALAGCQPDSDGCQQNASSLTNSTVTFTAACGGSGDHAAGSVVTPAPVVVPPVVITPTEGGGGA